MGKKRMGNVAVKYDARVQQKKIGFKKRPKKVRFFKKVPKFTDKFVRVYLGINFLGEILRDFCRGKIHGEIREN